jgi:hypothetical protein
MDWNKENHIINDFKMCYHIADIYQKIINNSFILDEYNEIYRIENSDGISLYCESFKIILNKIAQLGKFNIIDEDYNFEYYINDIKIFFIDYEIIYINSTIQYNHIGLYIARYLPYYFTSYGGDVGNDVDRSRIIMVIKNYLPNHKYYHY